MNLYKWGPTMFLTQILYVEQFLQHLPHHIRDKYNPPIQKNSDYQKKSVFCNELTSDAAYTPDINTFNTVFSRATTLY